MNPVHAVKTVDTPLLVIHSEDDPVCSIHTADSVMRPLCCAPPLDTSTSVGEQQPGPDQFVCFCRTQRGAHTLFREGWPWVLDSWAEKLIFEFFDHVVAANVSRVAAAVVPECESAGLQLGQRASQKLRSHTPKRRQ